MNSPASHAAELIGYTDHPVAEPGSAIRLAVSCSSPEYDVQLVRLRRGDTATPPGFIETEVQSSIDGSHKGRVQHARWGSYVEIADSEAFAALQSFTITLLACPTTPAKPGGQSLFSRRSADRATGGALGLDDDGCLVVWSGNRVVARGRTLRAGVWYWIACSFDAATGALHLLQRPLLRLPLEPFQSLNTVQTTFDPAALGCPVILAACLAPGDTAEHFNGRLEQVSVYGGGVGAEALGQTGPSDNPSLPAVAQWRFEIDLHTDRVIDAGPLAQHGRLQQCPVRAVPGHNWTGEEVDFRRVPDQYAAIHFHDDDVEDSGWDYDLDFVVPDDLPSGIYAFRLRSDGVEDHVPFFVRPARGRATANVAFLIPTYSYLAYSNERIARGVDFKAAGMTDRAPEFGPEDEVLARHPEFGISMYDHHSDGSGVVHVSWRRPLMQLRPRYRWWLSGSPQYLSCDLFIADWLEHLGEPFDVITDHCVDDEGLGLLSRYRVVITSSHPEYMSYRMMSAFEAYTQGGGRLMYLGGNGFYWVTTTMPGRPHVIEVRRGNAGTRAWESAPGEEHHSSTGERGGLWRHRGWSPNRVTGIGFAAQGWSKKSTGYQVNAAARQNPRASWLFDGISEDVIGDFGAIMGGAAGDELDRADARLGTPDHALVLASSGGHGPYYFQVHEDALFSHAHLSGEHNPLVKADVVFFETAGDGAVFSVGSKGWVGSLPINGFENNIARLTTNALKGMLDRSFVETAL